MRNSSGFTMAETLLTVAILLIVMALVFVNVFSYQKSLRQKELDDKAQIIYVAAQSQLSSLKANGLADVFSPGQNNPDVGTVTCEDLGGRLSFVTSKNKGGAASSVMNQASVDDELLGHEWAILYDAQTASVAGVFYSEEENAPFLQHDGSLAEGSVLSGLFDFDQRVKKAVVGYFGGGSVQGGAVSDVNAHVVVSNGEKLTATFSATDADGKPLENVSYRYWLTQETADGELRSRDFTVESKAAEQECTVTLDSLEEGKGFATQFCQDAADGAENLISGAPFDIHVTAQVKGGVESLEAQDRNHSSLFDDASNFDTDVDRADEGAASDDSAKEGESLLSYEKGTAVISKGRHLQNLDVATSGVDARIVHAIQVNDIDLAATTDAEKSKSTSSERTAQNSEAEPTYADTYQVTNGGKMEPRPFVPITNEELLSYTGLDPLVKQTNDDQRSSGDAAQSAGQTRIIGLMCKADESGNKTGNAGLFDTFYGVELSHVWLEDATVCASSAKEGSCAGALAAKLSRHASDADHAINADNRTVAVTDCRSYLSDAALAQEGKTNYRKQAGYQELGISVSARKAAGGLIGRAEKYVNVTGSFASVVVRNASYVGGLIGEAHDVSLDLFSSYADCYLQGMKGAETMGGLIGHASNTGDPLIPVSDMHINLDGTYASGYQVFTAQAQAASAAGLLYDKTFVAPVSIKRSYSACFFGGQKASDKGGLGKKGAIYEICVPEDLKTGASAKTTYGSARKSEGVFFSNANYTVAPSYVEQAPFKDGKKQIGTTPMGVTTRELTGAARVDDLDKKVASALGSVFEQPSDANASTDRVIPYQLDGQKDEGQDSVRYSFPVLANLPHYGDRFAQDVHRITLKKSELVENKVHDHVVRELLVTNGGMRANAYPEELLDDTGEPLVDDQGNPLKLLGWYSRHDTEGVKVLDAADDEGNNGGLISADSKAAKMLTSKDSAGQLVFDLPKGSDKGRDLYAAWLGSAYVDLARIKGASINADEDYLLVRDISTGKGSLLFQKDAGTSGAAKLGSTKLQLDECLDAKGKKVVSGVLLPETVRWTEEAKGAKKCARWVSDLSGEGLRAQILAARVSEGGQAHGLKNASSKGVWLYDLLVQDDPDFGESQLADFVGATKVYQLRSDVVVFK